MPTVNTRGYIHIYMGIFDNVIQYGSQQNRMLIGDGLLQFIYSDIQGLYSQSHDTIDDFESIHPYFTNCTAAWQTAFIRQLQTPHTDEADHTCLSLDRLATLQEHYKQLLTELYHHSTGYNSAKLLNRLTSGDQIGNLSCFSRMTLTTSHDTSEAICMSDYFVSSLEECLFLEFTEILKRRIVFKTCKNCGRLFVPRRSNMDYCPRIYTSDGKSCAEVGYTQTFARNVKNDELLQAYTRAYKAHYARMTKPRKKAANMTREAFEAWYQEARRKLDQARAGVLDADTFKAWLKE